MRRWYLMAVMAVMAAALVSAAVSTFVAPAAAQLPVMKLPQPKEPARPPYLAPDRKLSREQREAIARLSAQHRQWLLEVDPILTDEELAAFLTLARDYQRDAFIQRFWEVRNPHQWGGRNAFREHWEEKVAAARQRFPDLSDKRARVFLLNGPPIDVLEAACPLLLVPLEVWFYARSDQVAEEVIVIFYRRWASAPFRVWDPRDGLDVFFNEGAWTTGPESAAPAGSRGGSNAGGAARDAAGTRRDQPHQLGELTDPMNGCGDPDQAIRLAAAINWVQSQGMHWDILEARVESTPKGPGGEWVATFNSYSTDVPAGAPALPARLTVDFPGRRQNRTAVAGLVTVAAADAAEARLGEHRSYDLLLNGEVLQGGVLFESFRYKFDFSPDFSPGAATDLPLIFERWLRPGDYTLVVRVEDVNSGRLFRVQQPLAVPAVARAAPPEASPSDIESARLLAEANAALMDLENGAPGVHLVPPAGEMQTGMVRLEALTAGAGIAAVTFTLDGRPVLTKRKPPWSVELDLGPVPHTRTLIAAALGADGAELARDRLVLNSAGHRFRVALLEPRRGKRYRASLLAHAEAEAPEGETIARVEIYLDERRVATLYQPPWTQPIALPAGEPIAYVRAVAYLADGSSTEDLVFLNAPENLEEMHVDLVELHATVLDRESHPVPGLTARDFSVREDGRPQEIARCETVADRPLHAAVAIDVSASMEKSLASAQQAALRFFQAAIRPQDRAAVIPFNDHPTLAVKFTSDLTALAGGLAGLKAERGTALWDTIVFTLYYFNGVKGQRAILLLSDGRDEGSRFTWEQAIEFARRAGVTIYAIGLGDEVDKRKLARLAEETGGHAFFLRDPAELAAIYQRIQAELRAQYLVDYQSTNTSGSAAFRAVDLQAVRRRGLEVKTVRGYYP